jgi:hypothetical protein
VSDIPPPYFDPSGVSYDLTRKGLGVVYDRGQLHVVEAPWKGKPVSKTAHCWLCEKDVPYEDVQSIPVPKYLPGYGTGKHVLACAACRKRVKKGKR